MYFKIISKCVKLKRKIINMLLINIFYKFARQICIKTIDFSGGGGEIKRFAGNNQKFVSSNYGGFFFFFNK